MVEQRTENPCVPGSIPGGTTLNARVVASATTLARFLPQGHNGPHRPDTTGAPRRPAAHLHVTMPPRDGTTLPARPGCRHSSSFHPHFRYVLPAGFHGG